MRSKLTFSNVQQGIVDITGLSKKFELTVVMNKPDFNDIEFELQTDFISIDTEVEMRDNHLRSAEFFDVKKFSNKTFTTMVIKEVVKDTQKLTGTLSRHGIAKPVKITIWYRRTKVNEHLKTSFADFQFNGILKCIDFYIG